MFFNKYRIKTQLFIIFFFTVFVIGSASMIVSYEIASTSLKLEISSNLKQLTHEKMHKIQSHVENRIKHIALFSKSPTIKEVFTKIVSTPPQSAIGVYNSIPLWTKNYLKQYKESEGFYDLFLIAPNGDIVYTVIQEDDFATNLITGPYKDSGLAKSFNQSTTKVNEFHLSRFSYYGASHKPAAFVSAPIYDEQNNYIGTVAIQINADELYSLSRDYEGLKETGEIILATKINNHAQFLTPTRHLKNNTLIKIEIGSVDANPIQQAVLGKSGSGYFTDYRKVNVISHWDYIKSLGWGIVIKIDEREALATIYKLTRWYLIIAIISLVAMSIIIFSLSKTMVRPIHNLISVTRDMSKGNISARAHIGSDNSYEMFQLSSCFNQMADIRESSINEIDSINKQLSMVISNASQGIMTVDDSEKIILFNKEAQKYFGYSNSEIIGKNLNLLIPDATRSNYIGSFRHGDQSFLNAKDRLDKPLKALRKDGTLFPVEISISKYELDSKWYYTAFIMDITERKGYERKILEAKEYAERANKAKSVFLANMSHELRTPLHGILSFASLGNKKTNENEELKKLHMYFNMIEESGDRLLHLLNDLLDLAKLEAGKMEMSFRSYPLQKIVESVIDEQKLRLDEKEMQVVWLQDSYDTEAEIDEVRIRQVFTNLLSNAIKFNTQEKSIHLDFYRDNSSANQKGICFSVKDEGIGIPKDEIGYIFEKFNQSSITTTGVSGTGLGLPICREIIQAHGGKIWAEHSEDGGAVFKFCIPLKQKLDAQEK